MNIQPLNYCRKIVKQYSQMLGVPSVNSTSKVKMQHVIDLCNASQKFLLPDGGLLLNDYTLKALDSDLPLRLPHQFIALEWLVSSQSGGLAHRSVALVRERIDTSELIVTPVGLINSNGSWITLDDLFIPMTGYLAPEESNKDRAAMNFGFTEYPNRCPGELETVYISTVLSFLNALACSNVSIERNEPKNGGKKIKSAIPFDAYHILTIDEPKSHNNGARTTKGDRRSPRQHLRRGHIVRPEGQRPYWRNATIVAAGNCGGKIHKDYQLKGVGAKT